MKPRSVALLALVAAVPVGLVAWAFVFRTDGPAGDPAAPDAVRRAGSVITEKDYALRVGVIAHDSMQGRDTPSEGLDKTALWIASEFEALGLKSAAPEGGFIQRYPLVATALEADASGLRSDSGVRLAFGTDLLPFRTPTDGEVEGGLVLASGVPDEGALDGDALRGRHVAILLPEDVPASRRSRFALLGAAIRAGAASVLVVEEEGDTEWSGDAGRALRPRVGRPDQSPEAAPPAFAPMLQIRAASLDRILAGSGLSVADMKAAGGPARLTKVPGVSLRLTMKVQTNEMSAPNVVAMLPGSDPVLSDEYVVFSAHMDHVGIGTPDENGDSIFNGADDDASGTVGVMEVARAMAALPTPPRRSTVFLLVSGEEKGLWGSAYYADHPSVPIDRLVADINTDMIGRNWPDTIVAIGKEHSDLGATLNTVNQEHPELGMTAIDDIWPEESFYTRSDHFNFARKGVPILFFFNGTHPDYHGRDDEPDRIDAEKASRISKLVFYLGIEVANRDERPRWNPESYEQIVKGGR